MWFNYLVSRFRLDMGAWTSQSSVRHRIRIMLIRIASFPILGIWLSRLYMTKKYGKRVITKEKVKNLIQVQKDMVNRVSVTQSLPYHMVMDTINTCNLTCPFCPTGTKQLDRKVGRLGLDRAKKVIDSVSSHIIRTDLYSWGEPYMDPDIFDITRYAHDKGIYTNIHSVLSVKKQDLGRRIVESGLDCLGVTIDGLSQETLNAYRRGADFAQVEKNIKEVVKARKELKSNTPRIEIIFNIFKHNEHEIPQLETYAQSIGADAVIPRRAFIFDESYVPTNPEYSPRESEFMDTCWFLYVTLTIEVDGELSPCDTNTSKRWKTGDVDDLKDTHAYWNQSVYRAMRLFHSTKNSTSSLESEEENEVLCQHCDFVKDCGPHKGNLSPRPPSFVAAGIDYPKPIAETTMRYKKANNPQGLIPLEELN